MSETLGPPPEENRNPEPSLVPPAEWANDFASGEPAAEPPPRPYPFWGWLDVILFGLALIVALVVSLLGATFTVFMGWLSIAPATLAAQAVGMGAALFLLSRMLRMRYGVGLRESLEMKPPTQIWLWASAGIGTAVLVSILSVIFKLNEMDMPMKEFIKTDLDLLIVGIGAVTFGPVFEEMIFRGFLQPLFARLLTAVPGIVATALLFALPHGPQYGWHWQHLLVITTAGALFGIIRWRASSTTAAIIAHCTYNALLVLAAGVQRLDGMG